MRLRDGKGPRQWGDLATSEAIEKLFYYPIDDPDPRATISDHILVIFANGAIWGLCLALVVAGGRRLRKARRTNQILENEVL